MYSVPIARIGLAEVQELAFQHEDHFLDFKRKEIAPSKASQTLSAFANSAGGDLYIGLDNAIPHGWLGFDNVEEANGFFQVFNQLFPLGDGASYEFLTAGGKSGLVLHVLVDKTADIRVASNRIAYVRSGAQNLPVEGDALTKLKFSKGVESFESTAVNVDKSELVSSPILRDFVNQVVPRSDPESWLAKQQLIRGMKPTVAATLLYAEEPQIFLPKRCAIKIYRYKTSASKGSRETLDFDPITIEGCLYKQIHDAVNKTVEIVQEINVLGPGGLERAKYPPETLHEIITNAVLHRDYSVTDEIDVRIFDDRIEVESPGRLPGHVTEKNILDEQFNRNPVLVRLISKFPNPPNKDIGEGLNTAFDAMRKLQLKPPRVEEREHSVVLHIRHEPLATAEELVMEYLEHHPFITNSIARGICFVGSESAMQKTFVRMIERRMIEPVPGKRGRAAAYQKASFNPVTSNLDQGTIPAKRFRALDDWM